MDDGGYSSVLRPGVWMYLWPGNGHVWADFEPHRLAPDLAELGITGVIPQSDLEAPAWCTPARVEAFATMGVRTVAGIGALNPPYWARTAEAIGEAMVQCMRSQSPIDGISLDYVGEGAWDGHPREADQLAQSVLDEWPDAPERCIGCPWWAPLRTPPSHDPMAPHPGHETHPHAPYKAFARLVPKEIYTQAYGAPVEGLSAHMLAWSRDLTQWPSLGPYRIGATVQAYHRSLKDHLSLLLQEETIVYWNWAQMDATARYALRVRASLERVGMYGPDAILKYQQSEGLRPDGILGPRTAAKLGLGLPPKPSPAPVESRVTL